jgi:DNA-binding IclR family transcriptional regulator
VLLAVREGGTALVVDSANCDYTITIAVQPGDLLPLHCTAHGKALLSEMGRSQLTGILGCRPLQTYTKLTRKNIDRLSIDLSEVRTTGFATDEGEYHKDICGLAAPIRMGDDLVIGSIGIITRCSRLTTNALVYSEQVCKAAQYIGEMLA